MSAVRRVSNLGGTAEGLTSNLGPSSTEAAGVANVTEAPTAAV